MYIMFNGYVMSPVAEPQLIQNLKVLVITNNYKFSYVSSAL